MSQLGRDDERSGVTRRGLLTGAAAAALVPRWAAARDVADPKNHRPYRKAGLRGLQFLVGKMGKDGSYGPHVPDPAELEISAELVDPVG